MSKGLPAGVCNIVFGTGPKAGAAIVKNPDIPVLSFTGSTATGQKIMQMSAAFCKKISLEVSEWKRKQFLEYHCLKVKEGFNWDDYSNL